MIILTMRGFEGVSVEYLVKVPIVFAVELIPEVEEDNGPFRVMALPNIDQWVKKHV